MPISIATWNINSVRLRMPIVERLLREYAPDVVCLQETKCPDDQFPSKAFRKLGYEHIAFSGQKGYHGVATVARRPIEVIDRRGERFAFPVVSLSLGVASTDVREITTQWEASAIAVEMKEFAKKQQGSTYRIDRRTA